MWTSVSGAAAQAQSVDTVANNLANADTVGFKKDAPSFKEYLSSVERERTGVDAPHMPLKDKDLYPIDGKDQSHVVIDGTYTNFRPGTLRVTQNPLDVALDGPGFIEVSTPTGPRFTRQGSFKLAADGRLVTSDGNPVLAEAPGGLTGAQPVAPPAGQAADAARFINLKDRGSQFSISPSGEIYAGSDLIAKLNVVEFKDLNKLRKVGSAMFENKDNANFKVVDQTQVRQGVIETSNVNPIEEMTNLIKANRLFEHDLKAMKTYGEILQRESTDIGKL
jgi:flagellar basal-body rod protein FlgG